MKNVVFICRRNRFRSQIAEGIYNHLIKDGSCAASFGAKVLPEEEGILFGEFPRVSNTVEAMKSHGVDITKAYSKKLTPESLENADKIIVLTSKKDLPEWINNYSYEYWETIDYPGKPTFEQSEETIKVLEYKIIKSFKSL